MTDVLGRATSLRGEDATARATVLTLVNSLDAEAGDLLEQVLAARVRTDCRQGGPVLRGTIGLSNRADSLRVEMR
jgi:hypothetical protein